jgi:hypothetical protein
MELKIYEDECSSFICWEEDNHQFALVKYAFDDADIHLEVCSPKTNSRIAYAYRGNKSFSDLKNDCESGCCGIDFDDEHHVWKLMPETLVMNP